MHLNTLIFDLGGVLIDWNPVYVFEKVIPDAERRQYFFENICTHDWNLEQDAGRPIAEANALLIDQWPDWKHEIEAFYGRWPEMLGGPIEATVDLLQTLRESGQYRLLALTNWSAETFPIAQARYHFLQWFEGIVVSGLEKTRKPYADIYELLLKRYQVTPQQAVFIDDNLQNVAAACALGMQGIHFQHTAQLADDLQRMGVKV